MINTSFKRKLSRNIVVFNTDFDLENLSSAGISRVLCYCKSLTNKDVQIYILSSIYDYRKDMKKEKLSDNICLYISSIKAEYKSPITEMRFLYYYRFNKFIKEFVYEFSENNNITIVIYRSDFANLINCLFVFKIYNKRQVKLVVEKNELMTAIALNLKLSGAKAFLKWIRLFLGFISDLLVLFFDGAICISTRMEKLYKFFNIKTIRIPILSSNINNAKVNNNLFNNIFKIAYYGNFTENKDMILSFIKAFLANENKNLQLDIYGRGSKDEITYIKKAEETDPRINYKGLVSINEMALSMRGYNLLLLLRKKNLQNQYGFSTKLAEYLSSGVPILTTDFSDTNLYLQNNINCFMVSEKEIYPKISIIKKIESIMRAPRKQRVKIGENGKETVDVYFNPTIYSETLFRLLFD